MQTLILEIARLLNKDIKIRADFYELSKKKQQALIQSDLDALTALTCSENKLLHELSGFEKKRDAVIAVLSEKTGEPVSELTLSKIISLSDDEKVSSALEAIRSKLVNISLLQRNINIANEKVIEMRMEYAQSMMSIMTEAENPSTFYNSSGKSENDPERIRLFDRQI